MHRLARLLIGISLLSDANGNNCRDLLQPILKVMDRRGLLATCPSIVSCHANLTSPMNSFFRQFSLQICSLLSFAIFDLCLS